MKSMSMARRAIKHTANTVVLCLLAASATGIFATPALAAELVIDEGEVYTVTEEQLNLSLDRLVIGDNARIQFAAGVDHWELLARDATIGRGVVIDGRGAAGAVGSDGGDHGGQAQSCRSGKNGVSGEAGGSGNRGVDIYLGLDARRIDGLEVIADGGDGGGGGRGGQGQKAGRILNCASPNGGVGGSGGQGGQGGDGGNVVVSVTPLEGERDNGALLSKVWVSAKPGKGGAPGAGGDGGEGADGQYVTGKTLTGTQKWTAGGRNGRSGAPGEPGEEGRHGQVFVGGLFTGFQPSPQSGNGRGGFTGLRPVPTGNEQRQPAEEEIQMLRQQLKTLQERMEKLENR